MPDRAELQHLEPIHGGRRLTSNDRCDDDAFLMECRDHMQLLPCPADPGGHKRPRQMDCPGHLSVLRIEAGLRKGESHAVLARPDIRFGAGNFGPIALRQERCRAIGVDP